MKIEKRSEWTRAEYLPTICHSSCFEIEKKGYEWSLKGWQTSDKLIHYVWCTSLIISCISTISDVLIRMRKSNNYAFQAPSNQNPLIVKRKKSEEFLWKITLCAFMWRREKSFSKYWSEISECREFLRWIISSSSSHPDDEDENLCIEKREWELLHEPELMVRYSAASWWNRANSLNLSIHTKAAAHRTVMEKEEKSITNPL